MQRVKYVPADPDARAADRKAVLVMRCGQYSRATTGKRVTTPVEADAIAYRRGWVRLSTLPPAERAQYRKR